MTILLCDICKQPVDRKELYIANVGRKGELSFCRNGRNTICEECFKKINSFIDDMKAEARNDGV